MNNDKEKCEFCGSECKTQYFNISFNHIYYIYQCPTCGDYITKDYYKEMHQPLKNQIATYLYYHKQPENHFNFLGNEQDYEFFKCSNYSHYVSDEELNSFFNMTFSDKIELILLDIANKSEFIGDSVVYKNEEDNSAFFLKRFDKDNKPYPEEIIAEQKSIIINYLKESGYIKLPKYYIDSTINYTLTIDGWQQIEKIQRNNTNNKNVFIAMSFSKEAETTRYAIKKGISNAGYIPIVIDEITHNQQIVPELFKQIRNSKFLVIDVSEPNNGAYYEAGYASGLGKEVIFCCKRTTFDDEKKRPHFDVTQKQMIIWETEEELTQRLGQWINSLFG